VTAALADDGPVPRLSPLTGDGVEPRTARAIVQALRLGEPVGERPRVVAAMISSADGRAQLTDRSVGLGNPADRDLLRELRTGADAVLAGARTLHAERYATLLDPGQRAYRAQQGMTPHPLVVTVSRRLDAPFDGIPLFAEDGVPIVVATEAAQGDLDGYPAEVEVWRYPEGGLTFDALLRDLRARRGVRGVTCEGGPGLLRELLAQDRLDDLLLTLAPKLVAGDALGMLQGERFGDRGIDLELADVHRSGNHLFLHYVRPA